MQLLLINLFISVRWLDIIDILLVAVLLYEIYNLIKGTVAINIFLGILAVYVVWKLVKLYEMELLSQILSQFISVGVLALIIVFQQEIRQFLLLLGNPNFINKSKGFFNWRWQINNAILQDIEPIISACDNMSKSKTGALIVIAKRNELKSYLETGEEINSKISQQLIENIFFKNSPLHDGALIIVGNVMKAARCVLPVSDSTSLPSGLGLRHRAALGIAEKSDAISIIVSEQTGEISFCKSGELKKNIKPSRLKEIIEQEFKFD